MSWLEHRIRRYEHRRWTVDDNRRVRPFEWGLEHVGLSGNGDGWPRSALGSWAERTVAHSDAWFHAEPAADYVLHLTENSARAENSVGAENGARAENGGEGDRVLTFTSAVDSPWPENNRVHARLFAVSNSGPAVVVLPQWNAKWDVQVKICSWLNRCGITALRLSMPYHDRRMIPGHERADHLVGSNIGLTLQANRQAVLDVRRSLQWLASRVTGNWDSWERASARPSGLSPWPTNRWFARESSCMSPRILPTWCARE